MGRGFDGSEEGQVAQGLKNRTALEKGREIDLARKAVGHRWRERGNRRAVESG